MHADKLAARETATMVELAFGLAMHMLVVGNAPAKDILGGR